MSHRVQKSTSGLLLAVGLLAGLLGCQDSARKPVQVHPPEIAPPPARESLPVVPLPLDARRGLLRPLLTSPPNGIEWLAAQSQATFDAGELDFRAGRVGKAHEEFDDALQQLVASGFDIDADPRLSDLYHHIQDTMNADELEASREGVQEQMSTPAPIDEIAEVPIPESGAVDPNLRGRAEGEVSSISHDLPLMVNDPVLAYLNYFRTPRGSAIVETGLRRAGRYREMVQRVLREEGMP
jgi:membrane-bound lytic murein transglycosylase D